MLLWGLLFVVILSIFFGTVNFVPKKIDNDLWAKVKLKINSDICAGWCRVIPGKEVKFYKLDGSVIDHKKDNVIVIEKCEDSSTDHPVPQDNL